MENGAGSDIMAFLFTLISYHKGETRMTDQSPGFSLGYYSSDRKTGALAVIDYRQGQARIHTIASEPESDLDKALKPIFVGLSEDRQVVLLDPKSKAIRIQDSFPADAFPAHIYSDPKSSRDWFMNDGDKQTGNDTLNCGDQGSSVTVVDNSNSAEAKYLATICVGRGHHQACFSYPTEHAPQVPSQAYVSNLKDGSISVIGNDPSDPANYLKVIATINLCEPEKEAEMVEPAIPNNAFPHGLAYSPLSGKIYNLNNGYGTIAVIDPLTHAIERRIDFKGHSNLFMTPGGRYLIGRGADRKSDPEHVLAKLTVLDVSDNRITDSLTLPDIYISKYFFNPEGDTLYLTASSSGSPEQQQNLKTDALLMFDMSALPELRLRQELRLGSPAGTLDFIQQDGKTRLIASSNAGQGEVLLLDADSGEVVERIAVGEPRSHSRLWLLD